MSVIRDEKINDYLTKVCFLVKNKKVHGNIKEELYNHIDEIIEEYIAQGKSEEVAIDEALLHMGDPKIVGKNLNKVHKATPDWVLLAMTIAFVLFGIFTIGFMEKSNAINEYGSSNYLFKTLIFTVIGCVLSFIILKIDYRNFKKYSKYVYIGTIIFSFFRLFTSRSILGGYNIYEYSNWINLGPITINIYNVVLFILILSLAGIYANYNWGSSKETLKGLVLGFIPCIIFILVPSADKLTIYTLSLLSLLIFSSLKLRYIIATISTLMLSFVYFIFSEPYRIERFFIFLNHSKDPNGSGWLFNQLTALRSSANLIGHDLNSSHDIVSRLQMNNDFIFAYILYTFGWIAAILLIATVLAFIIRIGFIGIKTKDNYGKLLVSGLCAFFFGQFALNILMNFSMTPVFAIGLPFISYGGSSLVINLISVGLITSVYRWRNSPYKIA
ncbi:FtsW/RodA/SpoVE family cell cycle protein [Clostridium cellulovorans]|uniref:Cell cycle protein n=1 Tax=Clostridium cellulovorans (strain ATCC 35296 / DSM 3052 / OCM 3 / 743B) TaxID=573061 RepID=D9SVX9_CLOC7|nr:FtsW/RodA/SpoVE family cell cycle protein [Clostridium cellulovorans]ADL53190.1 cell cycle protein [Clostridium cellulovorans 743B]